MPSYYVNRWPQANGDHEVHTAACAWLPGPENRRYLGDFSDCEDAIQAARNLYWTANGCAHCSPNCHTR